MLWRQAVLAPTIPFCFTQTTLTGQTVPAKTNSTGTAKPSRAVHLTMPYLDHAVLPAAAIRAAVNGYPGIIDLLLEEAALVDVRDNKGLTPPIRPALFIT